jgi:glycosyltransferase involved in cell wall biosynthesis
MAEVREPGEHQPLRDQPVLGFEQRLPIAIVAPLYPPAIGGVEQVVEHLARGLVERGIAVEVIVTDPSAREASVEVRQRVVVRRFPTLASDRTYFASPRLARWLFHNARRYQLIHVHNYHALTFPIAAIAAASSRVPRRQWTLPRHGTHAVQAAAARRLSSAGVTTAPRRGCSNRWFKCGAVAPGTRCARARYNRCAARN